jgi:biofilm PGA synthesis N-glycosyltransferase PgaC
MAVLGIYLIGAAYLIISTYAIMIIYAISGWRKLEFAEEKEPNVAVSVLVAARNEARNIEAVVCDLFEQKYPTQLFEVIVIDDGSEDDTLSVCQSLQQQFPSLKVLSNQVGEGKKAALQLGISQARSEIIATVDADCRVPEFWLATMNDHWRPGKTKMLLAPIILMPNESAFQQIQSLEMHAIMGLTGGFASHRKPIMANGANLMYEKEAFHQIGGFRSSNNPSGDDVFTMLKMNEKWPDSIQFVPHFQAVVATAAQPNFSSFWQQRKRWLSKKSGYSNPWVKGVAILSYLANLVAFVALIALIFAFGNYWTNLLIWVLFVKLLLDLALIRTVSRDIQPYCGISHVLFAELFIVSYVSLLGILGNSSHYIWKGRSIKVDD